MRRRDTAELCSARNQHAELEYFAALHKPAKDCEINTMSTDLGVVSKFQ